MTEYEKLEQVLSDNKGSTDVRLTMNLEGEDIEIYMNDSVQVQISDQFFEGIHKIFGRTDFIEVQN